MSNKSEIKKLEQGRAEFAYRCAKEGVKIKSKNMIDGEYYEDRKYGSYVKKIHTMILSNGLGQTLAFIVSKRKKDKKEKERILKAGSVENPKNAYDLIYKQLTEYLKSNTTARIQMPADKTELLEWVISCATQEYRWITQEVLAFLNWLKRFAEGMIEEEEE